MKPSSRWPIREGVQAIGWACVFVAVVVVLPIVGGGTGQGWEPGANAVRSLPWLQFLGRPALVLGAIGLLLVGLSRFIPARD